MKFEVYAKRVVQWEGAPPIYLTEMTPSVLFSWAGVPRKSPKGMEGYQRALEDRYKKISHFMEMHVSNIIPGTVIIASDKGAPEITITELEIKNPEEETIDPQLHNLCKLVITYEPPESPKTRLEQLIEGFEGRLKEDAEGGGENNGNAGEGVITSRMGSFVQTLKELHENWDTEIDGKPEDNRDRMDWLGWIEESHKIGFIMDGQHRAWGAENVNPANASHLNDEDEPVLAVSIIPEMKVAEQVFHFSMMNITPVRVKAGHARSNASFSLTKGEFAKYEPRLASFTDTTDAIWNEKIDSDPNSPFKGRIYYDYLTGAPKNFLKESVATSVQREWRTLEPSDRLLGKLFKDGEAWKVDNDDFRMSAFFRFWDRIEKKFEADWKNMDSRFWHKVCLLELQKFILIQMTHQISLWVKKEKHPFDDLVSLADYVDHVLEQFPSDFFSAAWNYRFDDTNDGREDLHKVMQHQYGNEKVDRRHELYRGATGT